MEPVQEEEIYIGEVSGSDTKSDEWQTATDMLSLSLVPGLVYTTEEQEKVPSTADVQHFFERTSKGTVCRDCKYMLYG